MIKIYLLPVERIDNTDKIKGEEYIHHAIVECTEDPNIRKLIMDTTPDEDTALSALAIEVRDPTPDEIASFNTLPPRTYRYEAFTKEIAHPKKATPIYVDYEILEFNQELTADEISGLETELGKTIRKLGI